MGKVVFENAVLGGGEGAFVIAEAGVNHNGSLDRARHLVDVAAESGADAIKFQTFRTEKLVTESAGKAAYQRKNTGNDASQSEMLRQLELSAEQHEALFQHSSERGLLFMSTPFDFESADYLAGLGVPAFKVSSGDLTNTPFLARLTAHSLPLIVSTGMSTLAEVETAVETIERCGHRDLVLLHCVSSYPAAAHDVNLRAMEPMRSFGYPVGYSDHTLGISVPIAAVALGAVLIEKHFTLDRQLPGPDHAASLEPSELAAMVKGIREVESALGDGRKRPAASEMETARAARKSLVAAADIAEGTRLTRDLLAIKRPGTGIPPAEIDNVVGRSARCDIAADELLTPDKLQ